MNKILITGGSGFIGTHLIQELQYSDIEIINIDIQKPILEEHLKYWKSCDILDKDKLLGIIADFKPDWLVHLAADGSVSGKTIEEYQQNTIGTKNILEIIQQVNTTKKVVITSSQVVCKLGQIPAHDTDFSPEYAYAESKVLTEIYTREANLDCCWTIIRPTYIWGPYHPRNSKDLFYSIKKRWYLYPGKKTIIRSYGYVKNVAKQIKKILEIENELVDKQVFYVGDSPIDYYEWVNLFSVKLTGKPVRTIPKQILYLIALLGEGISFFLSKPFLMNLYRYKNMTSDNYTPMKKTQDILNVKGIEMEVAVDETVRWIELESK